MTEQPKNEDWVQRPTPLTDFYGEDRHELVQKLAYQHWEKRGRPLVRLKLIGLRPKGPCARTCWLQELNSGQTETCMADEIDSK
jgi:hypothetical protein